MKTGAAIFRLVICLAASGSLLFGSERGVPLSGKQDYAAFYDRFRNCIVSIENPAVAENSEKFLGTGIIVSPLGYIVTSNAVVSKIDRVSVKNDALGYYFAANVVGRDGGSDIALLKVKTKLPLDHAAFDTKKHFKAGELLFLLEERNEKRITSALATSENQSGLLLDREPGGYGAAVVDAAGALVGLVSEKRSQAMKTRASFDAASIASALERLMEEERVLRAYFGMTAEDLDPSLYGYYGIGRGVLVTIVENNSTADQAGLMRGDLIVGLGSTPVDDKQGFVRRVAAYQSDENVTLHYVRHMLNKSVSMRLSQINREILNPKAFWYKGMVLEDISKEWMQIYAIPGYMKGVVVTLVEPGSAAEAGGMRQGDVIFQLDTKSITDLNLFKANIGKGKKDRVFIYRDGWNFIKLF